MPHKKRRGENKEKVPVKRIYGNSEDHEQCPVKAYTAYAAIRPGNRIKKKNMRKPSAPFSIGVNTKFGWLGPRDQWILSEAIAVNKLGKLRKNIAKHADINIIDRNISHHSIRKTIIQHHNVAIINNL